MDSNTVLDYERPSDDQQELQMAGFGLRLAAILIDSIIIGVVCQVLFYGIVFLFAQSTAESAEGAFIEEGNELAMVAIMLRFALLIYAGLIVFILGYFVAFESSKFQGTPGKLAVGIQVVDEYGNRMRPLHALGRNVARIVSSIPFYIGYLAPLWTPRKQTFHDMVASTYVIKKGVKSVEFM